MIVGDVGRLYQGVINDRRPLWSTTFMQKAVHSLSPMTVLDSHGCLGCLGSMGKQMMSVLRQGSKTGTVQRKASEPLPAAHKEAVLAAGA